MKRLALLVALLGLAPGASGQVRDSLKAEADELARLKAQVVEMERRFFHRMIDAGGSVVLPPNPDPGDSIPPVGDPRMIQGRFPLVGWGWGALQACAPEGGGDWDVLIVPVRPGESLGPNDLPEDRDLVVVVFPEGGRGGSINFRNAARHDCVVIAGQTAPEAFWFTNAVFDNRDRDQVWSDVVTQGLGFIGSGSSAARVVCGTRVHFSGLTLAFAADDAIGFTSEGCGDHNTFTRSVVGPTLTRGGGFFDGAGDQLVPCAHLSYTDVLVFEAVRRGPLLSCGAQVTNVVAYNLTDAARLQRPRIAVNIESYRVIGGPITGCDWDRAIVHWEQLVPRDESMSVYLDEVRSVPAPGCLWSRVEDLWGAVHTVFHFSVGQDPVPFDGHGAATPHPRPRFYTQPAGQDALESHVLPLVGANWGLSCDGEWVRRENELDAVTLRRVAAREFTPTQGQTQAEWEAEHGPLTFPTGTPCPDTNGNGIPDGAETWLAGARDAIDEVGAINPRTGRPWILDYLGGR